MSSILALAELLKDPDADQDSEEVGGCMMVVQSTSRAELKQQIIQLVRTTES